MYNLRIASINPTKLTLLSFLLIIAAVSVPSLVSAVLDDAVQHEPAAVLAAPSGIYSHVLGNDHTTNANFTDLHNPSIFINETDVIINKSGAPVAVNIDTFNFYAKKIGNPVTPLVVRVDGDNDYTVLAIGKTQSSYSLGANSLPFADVTPSLTLAAGEKIATGFMDANADGSGWGGGGNPIPAEENGNPATGQDFSGKFVLEQDEVWGLAPSPLIEFADGFVAADTPAAVVGQKILDTNAGKQLQAYNLLRTYRFSIQFSADDLFAGATLYTGTSQSGTSMRFTDGITPLAGTAIGEESASSIVVEAGYVAYLCDGTLANAETCKHYPAGTYDTLPDFDNKAIFIKVDQNNPAVHGEWGDVFELEQRAIAAAQMPDGNVMFWQGGEAVGPGKEILVLNPITLEVTESGGAGGAPSNHDTFCPGPALLPNGDLILAGGGPGTEAASSLFEWESDTWNREEDMDGGHYYGTSVTLADGQVFHALGSTVAANDHKFQYDNPEIWTGTSWETLTGIDLSPLHADNGFYNSNYYPFLHLMPNSNLFHSGGVPTMHEINPNAELIHNQGTRAGNDVYRHWGNSIMIDEGLLFVSGGRPDNPESMRSTVLIDINNDLDIQSSYAADMNYDRAFHNMVQVPTGDVFVSGGNSNGKTFYDHGTVYPSELWDRDTDSWTEMAELTTPHNYHSTSLLLPDGRIWQAGGDCGHCPNLDDFNHHYTLQFYSPPYLFNSDGSLADRPVISSYPAEKDGVQASQSFDVTITGAGAADIADFNIIKLSSTTHQMNTDVRRLSLDFVNNGGGAYTIDAHDNINVMTPGYWMLFAVNQAGVPSVAATVHVALTPGTENPTPNPKPNKTVLGNNIVPTGGIDGWQSNLVINESDTYTNQSATAETWYLSQFDFYALATGGPVTPFVVTVNGDDDFTVKAIGTSRIPAAIGGQAFDFLEGQTGEITIQPGETIAIGFIDAYANGEPEGGVQRSIVARLPEPSGAPGSLDEVFYVGHGSANVASLTVGQAPNLFIAPRDVETRNYAFAITMADLLPPEATPTPEPTATATTIPTETPVATATVEPTATPTSTSTPTGPEPTATATSEPTVTATPVPTGTPDNPTGEFAVYLPVVTK